MIPAQEIVNRLSMVVNAVAQHHRASTVREQTSAYPRLLVLVDAIKLTSHQSRANLQRNTQHPRRSIPGGMSQRQIRTGPQRRQSTTASNTVEQYLLNLMLDPKSLGDEVIEARVRGVGAGGGNDVGDFAKIDGGLLDGFARGVDG